MVLVVFKVVDAITADTVDNALRDFATLLERKCKLREIVYGPCGSRLYGLDIT